MQASLFDDPVPMKATVETPEPEPAMEAEPTLRVKPPAHHDEAMRSPKPGHEAALVGMFRALAEYADAHHKRFEGIIADDCWLGEYFHWMGEALIAMLNGETGRLDCGTLDRQIRDLIDRGGSPEAIRVALDAVNPSPPKPQPKTHAPRRRSTKRKAEAAPAADWQQTKRYLSKRQSELLGYIRVEGNTAVFGKDEHVPDWAELKKVMTILGGKWKTKTGFVFPDDIDACETIRLALETGEVFDPKLSGFFPTPDELADRVVELAEIEPRHSVLEPSAGTGQLVRAIRRVCEPSRLVCFELLPDNVKALNELGCQVTQGDFLQLTPDEVGTFDRIVANPPFAKRADVHHILHMIDFLAPGGVLVSIASAGVQYRDDALGQRFRAELERHNAYVEENPEGAFKASGTGVRTVTIKLRKVG